MTFANPYWLLLFLPLAGWYWWMRRHPQRALSVALPQAHNTPKRQAWRIFVRERLWLLHGWVLPLLCLAMARPQLHWQEEKVKADALDIVLTMDISLSMLSRDFSPDRLAVAKRVAADFVKKRPYDRIGLVAFAAEAITQCPLTTDKDVVQGFIQELQVGRLEHGTAIGMGLATALNRRKDSPSPSKVIILLTDGENNAGYIAPTTAAELAQTLGVRVYTIGIGSDGVVLSPEGQNLDGSYYFAPRLMHFDTELLESIATLTKGRFYRAVSEGELEGIYAEIDRLEKTKVEIKTLEHTREYFMWPLGLALLLLCLKVGLNTMWLRSINLRF